VVTLYLAQGHNDLFRRRGEGSYLDFVPLKNISDTLDCHGGGVCCIHRVYREKAEKKCATGKTIRFGKLLGIECAQADLFQNINRKGQIMEVQLSEKAAEIVKEKVAAGEYRNASAFVSDIVLRADEFDRLKLERLRREVSIGLDEINRGQVVEFDLEDILNAEEK